MVRFTEYSNFTKIIKKKGLPLLLLTLVVVLVYSRFINLTWGFPFLMHPDENNMMASVMQLRCSISNLLDCFNPHFFAYGQLTLYLTALLSSFFKLLTHLPEQSPLLVSFSLRFISATSSVLSGLLLFSLVKRKIPTNPIAPHLSLLFFTFTPAFIQQAHFGTTEGLLSLLLLLTLSVENDLFWQSIFVGLAIAVKPSGALFAIVPLLTLLSFWRQTKNSLHLFVRSLLTILTIVVVVAISSPHYFINWRYFIGSFTYERAIATGAIPAFYTQQFQDTVPILFQLQKILPYAAGWVITSIGMLGLLIGFKRFSRWSLIFIFLFAYSSLLYAKWTRFIVPFLPILIFFTIIALTKIYDFFYSRKLRILADFLLGTAILYQLIVGTAFLSVYTSKDVRAQVTDWFITAIPKQTRILSESANVVDIPLGHQAEYIYTNPFINNIDSDKALQKILAHAVDTTEYIMIPSRRVFADYTCFKSFTYSSRIVYGAGLYQSQVLADSGCLAERPSFPVLQKYYTQLFLPKSKFQLVAEFSSYPRLQLFGKIFLEFPDEAAEETWTVFDHPVIRIYQRNKPTI